LSCDALGLFPETSNNRITALLMIDLLMSWPVDKKCLKPCVQLFYPLKPTSVKRLSKRNMMASKADFFRVVPCRNRERIVPAPQGGRLW
jgi:hypothetical protein